jgi:flagellar biosynthesis protein FliR
MSYFLYNFQVFLLVFTRMFGLFTVSPFLSSPLISISLRSMLAFLIAIVIFPVVGRLHPAIPDNFYMYMLIVGSELAIGMILGFVASIFFTIFQMAGEYFSMLIGLSISEILDPLTQVEVPIIGQFQTLIAMMVFFAVYGDHSLISATYQSYSVLPVLDLSNLKTISLLTRDFAQIIGQVFLLSMKLAFPVIGTLTILMISLALLTKAAPEMNIFMVGFPLQLAVGFLSLIFLAPLFGTAVARILELMNRQVLNLVYLLK